MKFGAPGLLPLLLLVPAVGWLLWLYTRWQQRALHHWADERLHQRWQRPKAWRVGLRRVLLCLGFGALLFALSQPRWGLRKNRLNRRGLQIVLLLDISPSMKQTDISPSRWQRAAQEVQAFLQQRGNDQIALIAFSGEAGLQCPFTDDTLAIQELTWHSKPGIMHDQGENLPAALKLAMQLFRKNASQPSDRVVLLLSDGIKTPLPSSSSPLFRKLRAMRLHLFAVGFGKARGAQPLRAQQLQQLAGRTGGAYFSVAQVGFGLQRVHHRLSSLQQNALEDAKKNNQIERFPIFLALGLCFLFGHRLLAT